ncbi:MAG: ferrochelatase [Rhodospirillaceae bacterium]|nr:ferrochelatase [Rhodospirillaceae bacterium]|tara:strand:- start:3379 stop:4494 length:1116 start_codon:yes stop_codon:yes gene_type:complete
MSFQIPSFNRKTKILLVQLGSPENPSVSAVRKYLKNFLGDPRVVDINPWIWKFILNFFVLPFRPRNSAKLYSRIWSDGAFPLIKNTETFTESVRSALLEIDKTGFVEVNHAFLLSNPKIKTVYDEWEQDIREGKGATKLIVLPMFPQYSESTVASGVDALAAELAKRVKIPTFELITNFHRTHAFIDNSVLLIEKKIRELKQRNINLDSLIISFHGMQKRRIIEKDDDYYRHCYETFRLISQKVKTLDADCFKMSFQSRFGSEEWITPYTDDVVKNLVDEGNKEIAIYSASFVADCLETLDELGHELAEDTKTWGGRLHPINCLNSDKKWCEDFARFLFIQAEGSAQEKEDLEYRLSVEDYKTMPNLSFEK